MDKYIVCLPSPRQGASGLLAISMSIGQCPHWGKCQVSKPNRLRWYRILFDSAWLHGVRQANRRNAMQSTGPRTRSGKTRSRANSLRHGLLSKVLVDPALVNETDKLARQIAQEHGKPDDCFESRTISRSRAGHFECARRACAAPGHHLVRACSEHQGRRRAPFRAGLSRREKAASAEERDLTLASLRLLPTLSRIDKYERIAVWRRQRAVRKLCSAM